MPRGTLVVLLLSGALLATGCGGDDEQETTPSTSGGSGGAAGQAGAGGSGGVVTVTLFHTNDEEGALHPDTTTEPGKVVGGVANFRAWLTKEGYDPSQHLLVSSGDNWTGQAVSTWFEGKSTVEVMNLLGYDAAAIGNHEFDFGQSGLAARAQEANFAYLSANIIETATSKPPSWAKPYAVVETQGVKVGLIGITTRTSSTSAHPKFVTGLEFTDEKSAVETVVPTLRNDEGADIVIVLAHECLAPMVNALATPETKIDGLFLGHCNEYLTTEMAGVPVVGSDHFWHAMTRIDYTFDRGTGLVIDHTTKQTRVEYPAGSDNPVIPDPEMQKLVDSWQTQADQELDVPVGHTNTGILNQSWQAANWFTDSWLAAFPDADVALLNFGSLRTPIPVGPMTLGDLVGMAPFKNDLVQIEITGAALKENLKASSTQFALLGAKAAVAGMKYKAVNGDVEVSLKSGAIFDEAATYKVITTDFLYYGGGQYNLQAHDPTPTELGKHMRDPVIDWTKALGTSSGDPVEGHIDAQPRDTW